MLLPSLDPFSGVSPAAGRFYRKARNLYRRSNSSQAAFGPTARQGEDTLDTPFLQRKETNILRTFDVQTTHPRKAALVH